MAEFVGQNLVVIHGELRNAIPEDAIVDRIHGSLGGALRDQVEIRPVGKQETISETMA